MLPLFDRSGRPVRIGSKLGKGGEGTVYRLANRTSVAVKVYTSSLNIDRAKKIELLMRLSHHSDLTRVTAWPLELVFDRRGQPHGLLVPVIENGRDIHNLYTPGSRSKHYPDADWRFISNVARNTARAFATIHSYGLVVGDVNPGSIMVLDDGTVRIIDVDSFQVSSASGFHYLCTVGVPIFLPPELHGAPLDSTVRSTHHDIFGLAITIFLLLLMGRHPYAGRFVHAEEMPIERAIREHRFAYGPDAASRGMERPPNAVGLEILPADLKALFEASFSERASKHGRPSAARWAHALDGLLTNLVQCGDIPAHCHLHGLSSCPWCVIEERTGAVLFGGRANERISQRYESEYRKILRQCEAIVKPEPVVPSLPATATNPSPEALAASKVPAPAWLAFSLGSTLLVIAVGLFQQGYGAPFLILSAVMITLGFILKRQRKQRWINEHRYALAAYKNAYAELDKANRYPAHNAARSKITNLTRTWDNLLRLRSEKERRLEADKQALQLRQFLSMQAISDASIKGIGRTTVAMLSSYGVDNALALSASKLMQIPGIGPKKTDALMKWRRTKEAAFAFNPTLPLPHEELSRLETELNLEQRKILNELHSAVNELMITASSESRLATEAANRVVDSRRVLNQALTNVHAAAGTVPK